MAFANAPENLVQDDDGLLHDRLLRSLHRDKDGHLSEHAKNHASSVEPLHNVAILYCYTLDDEAYSLFQHHVWAEKSGDYKHWREIARIEAEKISRDSGANLYGVYGWHTTFISITPLRTGDLFITVDEKGARGVRLAFNTGKTKRKTRHEKKARR